MVPISADSLFQRLTDRVFLIPGQVNIGVIRIAADRVVLIDSGLDRRAGRKILELLRAYQFTLEAILCTHGHSDHIGGNAFLHRTTQCRILAGPLETPVICHPLIQAVALFGGAPIADLQNRLVMADPSPAEAIRGDSLRFGDLTIQVLPLPGHSIGQIGYLVDGVAFLADALFPKPVMEKHRMLYLYDPAQQKKTLEFLRTLKAQMFVGGHFPPVGNIDDLLREMDRHVNQIILFLRKHLVIPQPIDRLVKETLGHFRVKQSGWAHFLYRSSVLGYLSAMKNAGEVDLKIMENLPVWYATGNTSFKTEPIL